MQVQNIIISYIVRDSYFIICHYLSSSYVCEDQIVGEANPETSYRRKVLMLEMEKNSKEKTQVRNNSSITCNRLTM